ncbi:LysM peptidoglycan-binding domain-containing protein [Devosia sp. XJ19-1]|uniref:LysM peptidoglycan-binding domain-containing protein n=1 Tax=Devosia ureilytica TaxID=2952754 RepID=A0A9Q4FT73_9HYPH|nr:LysM peptidoglycan-binding domain-containing protein [Devosia ureilytica]MCP8884190.1 LysM peptidoglycan-binding domain-containing protein [Devosia ureilytica]MCP8887798.1 LysM peptidoglycan-binding domain-containing protein [Devosia ureilytica]
MALTIGAAAVTLLVILGVLSGPSIVSCFNSADGMGQCLRGKMTEVGLIPAAPAPAVAEVETPTDGSAASVEVAIPPEPALDVTPPADAAANVDQLVAATFGLLRAEPDGSVVIAGSGAPGSKVQVFANGELLGTVEVEASGDWVFVPDAPLPVGGLEITLGEEGKPGTAEDSFIVVINEDKTSQPLVVASKPGEASEVLQGLTAPTQIAAAPEPATPVEPATEPATPAVAPETAVAEAEAEPVAEPSAMMAATEPAAPAPQPAEETATETADEPATEVADLPEPTTPPAPAADAPATAPAQATTPDTPPVAEQPAEPVTTTPDEPAAPDAAAAPATPEPAPTPDSPPAQLADVAPTIDAIEIETDRTFFAGAGPDGGIIRLYVEDAFVADATIEGGRWLVEAGPVLDKPSQRVRVDLLQPNSADVVARAEVDFVVDVPSVEEPVVVADVPAPVETAPEAPAAVTEPEATSAPAAPEATPAPAEPQTAVEPAIAPVTPPAEPVVAATTEPAAAAAPAAEPAPVAQPAEEPAMAVAEAAPADEPAPAPAAEPVATSTPEPVTAPAAEPAAVAEVAPTPDAAPSQPAVPTMVAVSLGDPEAQRFVSGKAIIRRGDNLWTIARRVYGEGLKYTTIYEANTGQIRNPDRIYPGQVFDLPEGVLAQ